MKTNLSVLNYQSTNTPQFVESNNKKFIEMGGDNHYPHYLEELFASSSIHGAIVKGCAEMIYGEGLDSPDKDENVEQWLKVKQIFKDQECLRRGAFDLKLYGQCYLNVIWSQDRSTISEVYHIPASTIRCGIADDEDKVNVYYHSTDWYSNKEPNVIPAFNVADRTAASQLLHIKQYSPLSFYYGLPDYLSSTNYIQVDADLSAYHKSNITNGLFPSCMINFRDGVPTQEERAELERLIYNKFGGASNAGKILMTFSSEPDTAPQIEPLNLSEAHKTYDFLSKEVQTKILSGHRVTTPLLFGVRNEGGGFGSNAEEMKDGYDLYFRTVINPLQELLIDGLRPILAASSITIPLYMKPLQPASFLQLEEIKDVDALKKDKDASYNGAQINSGVDVITKVQEGILTKEQAIVFLVQMLQFTPEVAEALFAEGTSAITKQKEEVIEEEVDVTELSKAPNKISKEDSTAWLEHLSSRSSELGAGWQLWKTEEVEDVAKDRHFHSFKKLHRAFDDQSYVNYERDSDYDVISPNGYLFAVRYSYMENAKTPPENPNYKSRDFCETMMDLSRGGAMYRYEDIVEMGDDGVNGQFAPSGKSTYDILEFKGGCFCRHAWQRNIFIYAPDGEIAEFSVDQQAEIQGDFDSVMRKVGDNPYVVNEGYETLAPIDMPDRGSLKYPNPVN
tara:strand:+ start:14355 stop:16385 length:2031 start_codon:yes stop_codon:yes gene_type:complete